MGAQPTTSGPLSGRHPPGPLSDLYRGWRLRPRLESPRLFWGLLSLAVLVDAAAVALAVCLVLFPLPAGKSALPDLPRESVPAWAGALLAAVLVVVGRAGRTRTRAALYAAGLVGCAALAAGVAARGVVAEGPAGWAAGAACLAVGAGLLLEAFYPHSTLAAAAGMALALGLFLVGRLPLSAEVTGLRALLHEGGWPGARALVLLGGAAALAVAWGCANLTLGLVVAAPRRRASIRTAAGAAYRALTLAVFLLAAGGLTAGLPLRGAVNIGTLVVLACCALLLHARFADWVQDLGLALGCALVGLAVALACAVAFVPGRGTSEPTLLGWLVWGVLANASLAVHAARRWYFSSGE
jgi:hypothetical protein